MTSTREKEGYSKRIRGIRTVKYQRWAGQGIPVLSPLALSDLAGLRHAI